MLWSWAPVIVADSTNGSVAAGSATPKVALCTVYNSRTHQHEEMTAWEVRRLIEHGEIEATTIVGEHPETRYRLI